VLTHSVVSDFGMTGDSPELDVPVKVVGRDVQREVLQQS
jgi:hypothetical protein